MSQIKALICVSLVCSWAFLSAGKADAQTHKTAIFVENRAGAALNDKVPVFQDFLSSRVTEKGLSIVSREVVINAINTYQSSSVASASAAVAAVGAETSSGQKAAIKAIAVGATSSEVAATPVIAKLDRALSDNSSALKLAQNMGVDYLLVASIASFGSQTKSFEDGDLKTINTVYNLRVSYQILENNLGGSLVADTVKVSKTVRTVKGSQTDDADLVNGLLDEAAAAVAEKIGKKGEVLPPPLAAPKLVEITVSCGMQDLANTPVSVPDIRVMEDGTVSVSTNKLGVQVLDATVEVDGIAVGSAPGAFKVRPGLSKMRVSREGFNTWERTVNFSDGQKFNVALQMSEAGYARWKDSTTFLFGIESGKKLTDGTKGMMDGFAQTLRQSGYRVDARSDVKANIEAKGKSLFDGASLKVFGQ